MTTIHPLWQDRAALDRLARRIATRLELHAVKMAITTGHPSRPYCMGPPERLPSEERPDRGKGRPFCGPTELVGGTHCKRCGLRVSRPEPTTPHF